MRPQCSLEHTATRVKQSLKSEAKIVTNGARCVPAHLSYVANWWTEKSSITKLSRNGFWIRVLLSRIWWSESWAAPPAWKKRFQRKPKRETLNQRVTENVKNILVWQFYSNVANPRRESASRLLCGHIFGTSSRVGGYLKNYILGRVEN